MLNRLRTRIAAVSLMAFAAVLMAVPAFAQTTGVEAVNTTVSSGVSDATSIVTTNIPLILGVAVLFVALKFGKRLLGKI
jgi:hypothetical protein